MRLKGEASDSAFFEVVGTGTATVAGFQVSGDPFGLTYLGEGVFTMFRYVRKRVCSLGFKHSQLLQPKKIHIFTPHINIPGSTPNRIRDCL